MVNKKSNLNFSQIFSFLRLGWSGLSLLLLGLTACSSSTTPNYYTLAPKIVPLVNSTNIRVIEVMPVGLPDRLDRAPLVLQEMSGKSNVLDNERWTSTLGAELRDGLSAGLQQKIGAVDRYNSGMMGGQISYRISADFSRFDIVEHASPQSLKGDVNRDVDVTVAWTIKVDDPNRPLTQTKTPNSPLSCRMAFSTPVTKDGNKIQNVVGASRQSLSRVIEAVSASVIAVEAKKTVTVQNVVCS